MRQIAAQPLSSFQTPRRAFRQPRSIVIILTRSCVAVELTLGHTSRQEGVTLTTYTHVADEMGRFAIPQTTAFFRTSGGTTEQAGASGSTGGSQPISARMFG